MSQADDQVLVISETTTQVLLQELAQIREDNRSALIQISAIMGVALSLLVVLTELAVYFRHSLPWFVYLTSPIVPGVLIAWVIVLGSNASVRTYYARSLETQLIERTESSDVHGLKLPSWSHFESLLNGAGAVGPIAVNLLLVYLGSFFIVVGWMTYVIFTQFVGWRIKVIASIVDVSLLLPPIFLAVKNEAHGRKLWHLMKELVSKSLDDAKNDFLTRESPSKERTLTSFLLLPRYEDLAAKVLFIPLTYVVVGLLAHRELFASQALRPAIGVWLVFEVLIYQARYLVNDVRGRVEDNSASTPKRRFPGKYVCLPGNAVTKKSEAYAVRLSFLSFIYRLIIGVTLFFTFAPPRYYTWLICLLFILGFAVTTLLYEWARHKTDDLFKKSVEENGSYENALKSKPLATATYAVVAMVGTGYAVRCLLALWLLGGFTWRVQLALSIFAWSYGSMFVYMTWIIESTKTLPLAFTNKAHLLLLGNTYRVRYACRDGKVGEAADVGPSDMLLSVSQSPTSVLTALGVTSEAAMVILLRIFAFGSTNGARFLILLLASLVCMIGTINLPMKSRRSSLVPAQLASVIGLIAAVLLLPTSGLSGWQRLFAVIALGCSPLTVLAFRGCSDEDIEDTFYNFMDRVRTRINTIPSWFKGEDSTAVPTPQESA